MGRICGCGCGVVGVDVAERQGERAKVELMEKGMQSVDHRDGGHTFTKLRDTDPQEHTSPHRKLFTVVQRQL